MKRDENWADDEHPALSFCGRVPQGGLVREVFSGQVYDRDFIFLVTKAGDVLAVHGKQDTEGRGGHEERSSKITERGIEVFIAAQNPQLEDASAELVNLVEATRERWVVKGGKLARERVERATRDGSFKDPKSGEWLFLMGARVFYAKQRAEPAIELEVASRDTVHFPNGAKCVLSVDADTVRSKGPGGAQTFTRTPYE